MLNFQKFIIIIVLIISSNSLFGQKWIKKHLSKHNYIENKTLDNSKVLESDSNTMYFPFFFIGGRLEAQLHCSGSLDLTDSLIIFDYKKNQKIEPYYFYIRSFSIRINEITEYKIYENNGITFNTEKINYMFLCVLSDKFRELLDQKLKIE